MNEALPELFQLFQALQLLGLNHLDVLTGADLAFLHDALVACIGANLVVVNEGIVFANLAH